MLLSIQQLKHSKPNWHLFFLKNIISHLLMPLVSKALKTYSLKDLFLVISYIDSGLGKKRGRGDDLFVDSLFITCLNVYRDPNLVIILHPPHSKFNGYIKQLG